MNLYFIEFTMKAVNLDFVLNNHLIGQDKSNSELRETLIKFNTKFQSELTSETISHLKYHDLSMLANYINLSGEGKF